MNKIKSVLCVNEDCTYVVFIDDGEHKIRYVRLSSGQKVWVQYGVMEYCYGVKISESCLGTWYRDLKPGDGPIELESGTA